MLPYNITEWHASLQYNPDKFSSRRYVGDVLKSLRCSDCLELASFVAQSIFAWNYKYKLKTTTPKNTEHNKISRHRDDLVDGECRVLLEVTKPLYSNCRGSVTWTWRTDRNALRSDKNLDGDGCGPIASTIYPDARTPRELGSPQRTSLGIFGNTVVFTTIYVLGAHNP